MSYSSELYGISYTLFHIKSKLSFLVIEILEIAKSSSCETRFKDKLYFTKLSAPGTSHDLVGYSSLIFNNSTRTNIELMKSIF